MEERLVAEDRSLDDHRRDRGDDRRAEQRGVHVADDFLEREQHRRDRRVEGRRQRAGRADRHEIPHPLRRQLQPAADHRREPGADLDRRALAPHRVPGADAQHAGEELAERHARRDDAAVQVIRRLGLRHAAAAHVGKHLRQQDPPVTRLTSGGTANSRRRDGARPNSAWLVCSIASVNRTADSPARRRR